MIIKCQHSFTILIRFGAIQRVHMVRKRGEFIGVAYVTFVRRQSAEKALSDLDGHRYDHLVLSVEWAPPRDY